MDPETTDLEGDGKYPGRGPFSEVPGAKAGSDSSIERSNTAS